MPSNPLTAILGYCPRCSRDQVKAVWEDSVLPRLTMDHPEARAAIRAALHPGPGAKAILDSTVAPGQYGRFYPNDRNGEPTTARWAALLAESYGVDPEVAVILVREEVEPLARPLGPLLWASHVKDQKEGHGAGYSEQEVLTFGTGLGVKLLGAVATRDLNALEANLHPGNKISRKWIKGLFGSPDPKAVLRSLGFDAEGFEREDAKVREARSAASQAASKAREDARKSAQALGAVVRFTDWGTGEERTGTTREWIDSMVAAGARVLTTESKGSFPAWRLSEPKRGISTLLKKKAEMEYALAEIKRRHGVDAAPGEVKKPTWRVKYGGVTIQENIGSATEAKRIANTHYRRRSGLGSYARDLSWSGDATRGYMSGTGDYDILPVGGNEPAVQPGWSPWDPYAESGGSAPPSNPTPESTPPDRSDEDKTPEGLLADAKKYLMDGDPILAAPLVRDLRYKLDEGELDDTRVSERDVEILEDQTKLSNILAHLDEQKEPGGKKVVGFHGYTNWAGFAEVDFDRGGNDPKYVHGVEWIDQLEAALGKPGPARETRVYNLITGMLETLEEANWEKPGVDGPTLAQDRLDAVAALFRQVWGDQIADEVERVGVGTITLVTFNTASNLLKEVDAICREIEFQVSRLCRSNPGYRDQYLEEAEKELERFSEEGLTDRYGEDVAHAVLDGMQVPPSPGKANPEAGKHLVGAKQWLDYLQDQIRECREQGDAAPLVRANIPLPLPTKDEQGELPTVDDLLLDDNLHAREMYAAYRDVDDLFNGRSPETRALWSEAIADQHEDPEDPDSLLVPSKCASRRLVCALRVSRTLVGDVRGFAAALTQRIRRHPAVWAIHLDGARVLLTEAQVLGQTNETGEPSAVPAFLPKGMVLRLTGVAENKGNLFLEAQGTASPDHRLYLPLTTLTWVVDSL